VTDKQLDNNLSEILPDYFNENQIKELKSLYRSSLAEQSKFEVKPDASKEKFKIADGIKYRSQVDLLVTFSSNKLSKEKFLSLLLYLSQVSITNGEFATAIEINEKIITSTSTEKDFINLSADAHLMIGEIYSRQAIWQNSFQYIGKARELFESVNDAKGIAKCENLLGTIYGDLGDVKNAIENFELALGKSQNDVNYTEKAKIEINLGIVNNIKGLYDEALTYFKRALINYEKVGDKKRIAEIHQNIGMVYTKKGDYTTSLKEFDESFAFAIETNYLQIIGFVYLSKAFVYSQLKDYEFASAFADKAMEIAYKLNDIIQRNTKNYPLAENYLQTSLRLNIETGNQLNQAETYQELGLLYKDMGKGEESEKNLNLALEYFKKINAEPDIRALEKLITLRN
jgi:tetratricopeptide (TPR) repeat protein